MKKLWRLLHYDWLSVEGAIMSGVVVIVAVIYVASRVVGWIAR